jgi:hypothetical protein
MIIGVRCEVMMDNHLQCPRPVEDGTDMCRVHNLFKKAADVAEAKAAETAAQNEAS